MTTRGTVVARRRPTYRKNVKPKSNAAAKLRAKARREFSQLPIADQLKILRKTVSGLEAKEKSGTLSFPERTVLRRALERIGRLKERSGK